MTIETDNTAESSEGEKKPSAIPAGDLKQAAKDQKAAQVGVEGLFADKKAGKTEDEERQEAEKMRKYYEEYREQEEIFEKNRSSYAESYLFNDEDIERLEEEADTELRKREMAYYRDTDKIVEQLKRTRGGEEALQVLLKLAGSGNTPEEVTEEILSSQSGKEAASTIEEWRGSSMTDTIQKGFKDWNDFQRRNLALERVRDMKRIRLDHKNPEDISRRIEAIDMFLEEINEAIYGHRPPGVPTIISKEWADYVSHILSEIRTQIKYEGGSYAKYLDNMLHKAMEGIVDTGKKPDYAYSDQQHTKHLDPKFKDKIRRISGMLGGLDYIEDLDDEHERLWSRNRAVEEELRR